MPDGNGTETEWKNCADEKQPHTSTAGFKGYTRYLYSTGAAAADSKAQRWTLSSSDVFLPSVSDSISSYWQLEPNANEQMMQGYRKLLG